MIAIDVALQASPLKRLFACAMDTNLVRHDTAGGAIAGGADKDDYG